jgi:hypothetical protein
VVDFSLTEVNVRIEFEKDKLGQFGWTLPPMIVERIKELPDDESREALVMQLRVEIIASLQLITGAILMAKGMRPFRVLAEERNKIAYKLTLSILPAGIRSLLEVTEGKSTIHVPEVALQIDGLERADEWRSRLLDIGTNPDRYPALDINEYDSFCANVANMITERIEGVVIKP